MFPLFAFTAPRSVWTDFCQFSWAYLQGGVPGPHGNAVSECVRPRRAAGGSSCSIVLSQRQGGPRAPTEPHPRQHLFSCVFCGLLWFRHWPSHPMGGHPSIPAFLKSALAEPRIRGWQVFWFSCWAGARSCPTHPRCPAVVLPGFWQEA